jgi:hypothetical protein
MPSCSGKWDWRSSLAEIRAMLRPQRRLRRLMCGGGYAPPRIGLLLMGLRPREMGA